MLQPIYVSLTEFIAVAKEKFPPNDCRIESLAKIYHHVMHTQGYDAVMALIDKTTRVGYVDLSCADLSNADFSGCNFAGFDFSGANLEGSNFNNCIMSCCYFANAILTDCTFVKADLSGAVFYHTNINGAYFHKADFYYADMYELYTDNADFSNALYLDKSRDSVNKKNSNK